MIRRLLEGVASPYIRFCFDTGHHNVFAVAPVATWIEALGPYLGQLHIHDNDGKKDRHLPPGEGNFPFTELFDMLSCRYLTPVVTLETHSVEHFRRAVAAIDAVGYLPFTGASGLSAEQGSALP
jgi:sugar phosphate isomerase/epimerase